MICTVLSNFLMSYGFWKIFGEKYAQERLVGTEQAKTTAALENTEAAAVPK